MPNVVEIIVRARDMTGDGFGRAEGKATGLGAALTKFAAVGGLALAAVGYESVRMASKFDASMEMLATQAGVPQGKIASLKSGVLALASQVGFSPDSLAESLYHVASNMQSMGATSQQMMNVVKVAAEGARIGNADLVDVTNALTSAVASGIPGVKNYSQAMGALNAIVGTGDMHMQDLAEAFSTGLLPVMKQYGLSLKDVGASLATFGDLNIRGQEAATKLRMAVQSMTAPTAQGKKDFAAMGMSFQQLADDMRHGGLMQALTDLQKHYAAAGITGTKVGEALTVDFGKKAGVGLAVLLGNMERLKSKYPDIAKGASDFGDAWKKTLDQTATVFARLRGWFDALMISIGEKLLPAVKSFGEWMLNNKTAIEVTLAVLAALVGVVGTYTLVTKGIVIATEIWAGVQKVLNGSLMENPLGLIITAVVILIPLIIEAYKHSKLFRDIVHDIGEAAKTAFRWVLNAAKEAFEWIKSHWSEMVHILAGPVDAAVAWITGAWHTIMRGVADVVDFIHWHWRLLLAILLGPVGLAVDAISAHWHTIMHGLALAVDFIRSAWDKIVHILAVPVRIAVDLIAGYFRMVWHGIADVAGFIRLAWDAMVHILSGPVRLAVSLIMGYFRLVWHQVLDVVGFIRRGWSELENILTKPVKAAYNTIMGWFHDIENWLGALPGKIASAIPGGGVLKNVASFFGLAHGGIVGAATGGVHGGLRLVGEYGPELVRMPYGSTVYSSAQSMGMLGGGGGGGALTVQLEFAPGAGDQLIRGIREYIRIRGGNVQRVLGQGHG